MNSIKNKYDLVFFIEAVNCNYNGDPDAGNLPRIDDEDMYGIITDCAIKRRIRDYIETVYSDEYGFDIVVKDGNNLNKEILKAVKEANGMDEISKEFSKNGNPKVKETSNILCKKYFDVRTFGGVMTTGLNGGQITGPVQIEMARSLDPVEINDICIDRIAVAEENYLTEEEYEKWERETPDEKKRTMGRKQFATFALFECHVYISPMLASKTGFSEKDLNRLIEAITNMYAFKPTSSKQGMKIVGPVFIFKHIGCETSDEESRKKECLIGCVSSYKLHNLIKVSKKENVDFPRSFRDYNAIFYKSQLPNAISVGFKINPFSPIEWNNLSDDWFEIK